MNKTSWFPLSFAFYFILLRCEIRFTFSKYYKEYNFFAESLNLDHNPYFFIFIHIKISKLYVSLLFKLRREANQQLMIFFEIFNLNIQK